MHTLLFLSLFAFPATLQDDEDGGWKVKVDPPKAAVKLPENLPYTEFATIPPGKIYFPEGLTPFLLAKFVANNNDYSDNLLIGSLATGKRVTVIKGAVFPRILTTATDRPALSPDGKYLAVHLSTPKNVSIVDTGTLKVVRVIPTTISSLALRFAGPTNLLGLNLEGGKEAATVWDVTTGKELSQFKIPVALDDGPGKFSISPGGNFLALPFRNEDDYWNRIGIYDLQTGKLAGEVMPIPRRSKTRIIGEGICFSPDGKELAVVAQFPHPVNQGALEPNLLVWGMDKGTRLIKEPIERGNRGQMSLLGSEPIQWFPDQNALLLDHRMVTDKTTGKMLDYIDAQGDMFSHYSTKVLTDTKVLVGVTGSKMAVKFVKRK